MVLGVVDATSTLPEPKRKNWLARERNDGTAGTAGCGVPTTRGRFSKATVFPNVDAAKIRDTVGFMVNVSYLGILQQRLTTRPVSRTNVRFETFVVDVPPRRTRTQHGDTRTPIQSGRGRSRCVSFADVEARLIRYQIAMYTCQGGPGQFRLRTTIWSAVVSVQRISRRRHQVNIHKFQGPVVKSFEECVPQEKNQCAVAPASVVSFCSECVFVFLSDDEPQSRMRLR